MSTSKTSNHAAPSDQRIGKYEICALVGSGGMGTVYRARLSGPGQATKAVALKVLHPHLGHERDFIELFTNEMRLAMAMAHRNIVQTFDAGEERGRHFMVMELVDGCSLRALLRSLPDGKRLPLELIVFIGREIAAALAYAHGLELELELELTGGGVIHRDVCPNNILLSRQGDVKLADFGVAKAIARLDDRSSVTIKGKLRYMSPEQAQGRAGPRSDLFALGAVLHELVYGRALRAEASLEAVRRGEVSEPGPAVDAGELPPGLVALVQRCTRPDPEQRVASAAELERALDAQLLELRQRGGAAAADPHRQLGALLAERLGPSRRPDQGGDPDSRAQRLAMLLLADEPAAPAPGSDDALTVRDGPGHTAPGPRKALLVGATAILLALSLGIAGLIWWLDRGPTNDGALTLRADAQAAAPAGDPAPVAAPPARADAASSADRRTEDAAPSRPPRRKPARRRPALLDINAVPWAYVYVDGKRLGVTPRQGLRLAPGVHRVRLVNPALKASRTLVLRLRPGQRLRRVVILK